jgi:hypothetical protein
MKSFLLNLPYWFFLHAILEERLKRDGVWSGAGTVEAERGSTSQDTGNTVTAKPGGSQLGAWRGSAAISDLSALLGPTGKN